MREDVVVIKEGVCKYIPNGVVIEKSGREKLTVIDNCNWQPIFAHDRDADIHYLGYGSYNLGDTDKFVLTIYEDEDFEKLTYVAEVSVHSGSTEEDKKGVYNYARQLLSDYFEVGEFDLIEGYVID